MVNESELVWHRDKKDREVTVLDGIGWKLQFENQIPTSLEKVKLYHIKKAIIILEINIMIINKNKLMQINGG